MIIFQLGNSNIRDELLSTHQCYEKGQQWHCLLVSPVFFVKQFLLKSLVKAILFIGQINILLDTISIVKFLVITCGFQFSIFLTVTWVRYLVLIPTSSNNLETLIHILPKADILSTLCRISALKIRTLDILILIIVSFITQQAQHCSCCLKT